MGNHFGLTRVTTFLKHGVNETSYLRNGEVSVNIKKNDTSHSSGYMKRDVTHVPIKCLLHKLHPSIRGLDLFRPFR